MEISLSAETIANVFGFNVTNSFLTSIILSFTILIFSFYFTHIKLKISPKSRSIQNVIETIFESLFGLFETAAGEKTRIFFPLAATFFIYILLGNWLGLLPGFGSIGIKEVVNGQNVLIPLFRGATADLNTTMALALISVASFQYYGFQHFGFRYLKKFFNFKGPIDFYVGLLELISEFARILSFGFRLFGNIFAGEVLLTVMAFLLPFILPLPFLGLELFVGLIQAVVFVMLSLVLLKVATSHEH